MTIHHCFPISRCVLTIISSLYVGSTTKITPWYTSSAYQQLNMHRDREQAESSRGCRQHSNLIISFCPERARVGRLLSLHEQQFKALILPGLHEVNIPVSFFVWDTFQVKIFHFQLPENKSIRRLCIMQSSREQPQNLSVTAVFLFVRGFFASSKRCLCHFRTLPPSAQSAPKAVYCKGKLWGFHNEPAKCKNSRNLSYQKKPHKPKQLSLC